MLLEAKLASNLNAVIIKVLNPQKYTKVIGWVWLLQGSVTARCPLLRGGQDHRAAALARRPQCHCARSCEAGKTIWHPLSRAVAAGGGGGAACSELL